MRPRTEIRTREELEAMVSAGSDGTFLLDHNAVPGLNPFMTMRPFADREDAITAAWLAFEAHRAGMYRKVVEIRKVFGWPD